MAEFPNLQAVAEQTIRNAWHAPIPVPSRQVACDLDIAWLQARTIETVEQLDAVPRGAIIRSDAGSIVCRYDAYHGVAFGEDRPFPWQILRLPALLVWHPDWSAT